MELKTTNNKKRSSFIGILCGIMAAICYGTNPLGALKLYDAGLNVGSVLFYRFGLALIIMTALIALRHESLRLSRRQFVLVSFLGVMFSLSSLSLYLSFRHMAAGIASTLLFVYPILTGVILVVFFGEKMQWHTVLSILLAFAGVALLYWNDMGGTLSLVGVVLVMVSSLTYALYIIAVDKGEKGLSPYQINFYVLAYSTTGAIIYTYSTGQSLQLPPDATSWFYACWLAVVPAILALVLMVYATNAAGSTATAITGAFEPITAVMIGITIFNEPFSLRLAIGITMTLIAVMIIALRSNNKNE